VSDKLPPSIINQWPEVLKDIEIKAVPAEYLKAITVTFTDGNSWYIDINEEFANNDNISVEDSLESFFEEYNDTITSIEFQLDAPTLISDIKSRTKTFMKKRK
jgi:hypothetical protein